MHFQSFLEELDRLYEADSTSNKIASQGGFSYAEMPESNTYRLIWRDRLVIAELKNGVLSVSKYWNKSHIEGATFVGTTAISDFIFKYAPVLKDHIWTVYKSFGTETVAAYIADGLKTGAIGRISADITETKSSLR